MKDKKISAGMYTLHKKKNDALELIRKMFDLKDFGVAGNDIIKLLDEHNELRR